MKSSHVLMSAAALTGLLTGAAAMRAATVPASSRAQSQVTSMAGHQAVSMDDNSGKHDCAGKNGCKSQGGCKTGDGGCAGKNSCKGKGGCKTNKSL